MAKLKAIICPYCGETQAANGSGPERCKACGGLFEPLSRQATHNAMGPWQVRDDRRTFQPGCSYETLVKLIERGQVTKHSIIRGPTTKQFWTIAKRVPGVSHLLGYCHNCDASVDAGDHGCHACGVPFGAYLDRNFLGLPEIRPLPWEAAVDEDRTASSDLSELGAPQLRRSVLSPLDVRRAAEPLGISSFASDSELRSVGLPPMQAGAMSIQEPDPNDTDQLESTAQGPQSRNIAIGDPYQPSPRWTSQSSGPAVPSPAADVPAARSAMRSLQRRIDDLRRTIRILAIALIIAVTIGIAATIALLSKGEALQNEQADPVVGSPPAIVDAPSPQPQIQPDAGPSDEVIPSAESTADAVDEDYRRAQSLIDQARQTDRSRADRISDYQEALRMLTQIAAAAPNSSRSADLTDEIRRIEHELEALQLEEFFP